MVAEEACMRRVLSEELEGTKTEVNALRKELGETRDLVAAALRELRELKSSGNVRGSR